MLEQIETCGVRFERDASIAITAGSRGIANIASITRAIVDAVRAAGAKPFIVPAMGSHGGGSAEPTVSYYTSEVYRESVKDSNKAAKKFLGLPADQIYADVKAFVVAGARDSDTPASCN